MPLTEHLELIFFFGLLAIVLNGVAWIKGFYLLTPYQTPAPENLTFRQIAYVFAIYLGCAFFLSPLLLKVLVFPSSLSLQAQLQLLTLILVSLFLFLFCLMQDRTCMKRIWKNGARVESRSIFYDFGFGIFFWFLSFPVVVVISEIADLAIYMIFGVENYEQVAVRYLKTTLESPSMLAIALFSILIAAPFLEELIFRGFLQTWIKKHVGTKAAILLASLCFALFHLNPSQGIGNLSFALSLFTFACFLGFIYERQASLFAPIGLHMAFNLASTVRILFQSEG